MAGHRERKRGRLRALLDRFAARVACYQGVFEALDELDACAWVLDPPLPASRSVLWRRVAVGQHVSLQLSVSPLAPRALCECHFVGSEGECAGLRERFLSRQREWSHSRTLRANLEALLGAVLPAPPPRTGQEEPLERECGICYSYRLPAAGAEQVELAEDAHEVDEAALAAGSKRRRVEQEAAREPEAPQGVVPDCYCDNAKCARGFHGSCLVEWLRGLPTTRHTLDSMFGTCPYCAEPISVRRTR
jgi:E3 ubiquitin-protein ligase FANCL